MDAGIAIEYGHSLINGRRETPRLSADSYRSRPDQVQPATTVDYSHWNNNPNFSDDEGRAYTRLKKLLRDEYTPAEELYREYQKLNFPRAARINRKTLRLLLHRLSHYDHRGFHAQAAMVRYLSILDEMKATSVHITRSQWDTSIKFAAQASSWIRSGKYDSVVSIWKEMENYGVMGNHITLTTLYNVANKAGRYADADRIWNILLSRGLPIDRISRSAEIYAFGLRKDGDRVRSVYNAMVDAGEVIDTNVLNCVIASLIIADEGSAAEEIFSRMKILHEELIAAASAVQATENRSTELGTTTLNETDSSLQTPCPNPRVSISYERGPKPSTSASADRALRSLLSRLDPTKLRQSPALRSAIQAATPVMPNHHTFRCMLSYYALRMGNLDQSFKLLNELPLAGIPLSTPLFDILFRAFALHYNCANVVRSASPTSTATKIEVEEEDVRPMADQWTSERLGEVWHLFVRCVERGGPKRESSIGAPNGNNSDSNWGRNIAEVVIDRWVCLAAVEAMNQVFGARAGMSAWAWIKCHCDVDAETKEEVEKTLSLRHVRGNRVRRARSVNWSERYF